MVDNTRPNASSALPVSIVKHNLSIRVIKLNEVKISTFDQGHENYGEIVPISNDAIEGIKNHIEVNSLY